MTDDFFKISVSHFSACFTFALASSVTPAAAMEWRESSFTNEQGQPVSYVVVATKASASRVRVLAGNRQDALENIFGPEGTNRSRERYGLSIESVTRTAFVTSLQQESVIVMSGGLSSVDASRPGGLLIENNRLVRQLNLNTTASRRESISANQCNLKAKYRWSGVLCANDNGTTIYQLSNIEQSGFKEIEQCRDALQSFPLIVEPGGSNGICPDEATRTSSSGQKPVPERRSLICVSGNYVKFIITDPTHLYPLAKHLIDVEKCESALNFSGSIQAGIAFRFNGRSAWNWWPRNARFKTTLSSVIVAQEFPENSGHLPGSMGKAEKRNRP